MDELTLIVDPALRDLLTARHRVRAALGDLRVAADPTSTVGHVVQSVGVPLTEVGSLVLDGAVTGATDRARPGRLAVLPAARPQPLPTQPARFLLDVHLGSLARLLRVLGLDVAYDRAADDDALVAWAAAQRRVLLTQDRGLLRRRAVGHGAFVRGAGSVAQLDDVLDRFAPDLAPWTRCPACNALLEPAERSQVAHLLKPGTRRSYSTFARCPACGRVYWRGAHARRLDAVVAHAQEVVAARRASRG
ncbi:MAG TPA: Mut7-C RNAse domain-containing protein [Angustibacter sp.]|nr:Mut7-C RNAse domain-containing protein [Angustibacter sp.]